jgi:hypothetical protein
MVGFICVTFFHLGVIELIFFELISTSKLSFGRQIFFFFYSMTCASSLALTTFEDTPESFKACTSENAHVVSEIFCLLQTTERMSRRQVKFCRIKSLLTSIQLKVTKIVRKTDNGTVSFLSAFHSSLSFLNLFTRVYLYSFSFFLSFIHSLFLSFNVSKINDFN